MFRSYPEVRYEVANFILFFKSLKEFGTCGLLSSADGIFPHLPQGFRASS